MRESKKKNMSSLHDSVFDGPNISMLLLHTLSIDFKHFFFSSKSNTNSNGIKHFMWYFSTRYIPFNMIIKMNQIDFFFLLLYSIWIFFFFFLLSDREKIFLFCVIVCCAQHRSLLRIHTDKTKCDRN